MFKEDIRSRDLTLFLLSVLQLVIISIEVVIFDALVNEFQEKNKKRQTDADAQDDECAGHVGQSQRLLTRRCFFVLHQALVNSRLIAGN